MASMFEEVTMEQAEIEATARRRHYEFIEKMAAIMAEYGAEVFATCEGEISIWTHENGEAVSSEPTPNRNRVITSEEVAHEMTYREFNTPTAEAIFNNHKRWAAERAARTN